MGDASVISPQLEGRKLLREITDKFSVTSNSGQGRVYNADGVGGDAKGKVGRLSVGQRLKGIHIGYESDTWRSDSYNGSS